MDNRLRTTQRRAAQNPADPGAQTALLVERLRAGEVSREDVRLWAYLGNEVAAGALGLKTFYVHVNSGDAVFAKDGDFFVSQGGLTDEWGEAWAKVFAESNEASRKQAKLSDWLAGLLPRLETLPAREFEVACYVFQGEPRVKDGPRVSSYSNAGPPTGTRTLTIPAARWLCVHGCLEVARGMPTTHGPGHHPRLGECSGCDTVRALDACAVWLKDPTDANARAIRTQFARDVGHLAFEWWEWIPWLAWSQQANATHPTFNEGVGLFLTAAAQHLPDARKVFAEALLTELRLWVLK